MDIVVQYIVAFIPTLLALVGELAVIAKCISAIK